ncbi:MAG: MATE family efflux transporter [Bacteroidales bacterium]|nr:MATE family efflux transporter [Bacteroidales bacterium]
MPLLFGSLAQNIVVATDTAFLARVGELELAASAIAGAFYVIMFVVGMGFGTGTQILISRRNGEKNYRKIGPIVENSLYFIWAFAAIIVLLSVTFSDRILGAIISSEAIAEAAVRFLNIRVFTLFFALGSVILSRFFVGIQFTKYVGIGALIVAVTNLVFDYVLIFGKFGFPKMGLEGAALAAVLAEIVGFAFFVIIIFRKMDLKKYNLFRFKMPRFSVMKGIFNLSSFTMLQYFTSVIGWFLFFVFVERTGERNLAVSNIIRSFYLLILTPQWAFGEAVSTLVSNAIGEGRRRYVFPIIRKVATFSVLVMVGLLVITVCFPNAIMSLYTNDISLIELGINGLYVVAVANVIGGISWIIFVSVSATGNTHVAFVIDIIVTAIYVYSIYVLAQMFADRIAMVWLSEIIFYITQGIGAAIYLSTNHWKKRVI